MIKYRNHILWNFCKGVETTMKKSAYYNAKIKHQLKDRKERKIKFVVWKLHSEQLDFVMELGYRVEEYLYQIKTKQLRNLHSVKNKLLKEIHFKNKKGTNFMVRELDESTKKLLEEHGIKYRPYKYKIYFNE